MTDVGWLVRSVVEGDQRALDRGAKLPVEPDSSGQGQQPLGDPNPDTLDGVGAVVFQAKLVLEGVEEASGVRSHSRAGPGPRPGRPARRPTAWAGSPVRGGA